jgi:hypothetical protein
MLVSQVRLRRRLNFLGALISTQFVYFGTDTIKGRAIPMTQDYDIRTMAEKIELLKKTAMELKDVSGGIKTVERNVERMLASIRVLELGVSDVADVL